MAKAYERILSSHASSFASTAHTPPRNSITFIALRLGIKMLLTLYRIFVCVARGAQAVSRLIGMKSPQSVESFSHRTERWTVACHDGRHGHRRVENVLDGHKP